ncbi:MAG: hypothetical protein MI923_11290 [Phycisphaerales bacterium]|nr:hypothetical protein [Phycisphaerales bacterium]
MFRRSKGSRPEVRSPPCRFPVNYFVRKRREPRACLPGALEERLFCVISLR